MSNSALIAAANILKPAQETVKAARIVAEVSDDVDLAVQAAKAALRSIEQAMVEASAVRARTKLLSDLHRSLERVDGLLSRDFHEEGQQDTIHGRTYVGSMLIQRLNESRRVLQEVIDSDDI